ncbi:2,4'-dihydroxyacetophenone dioxygenase family protein [Caballeronia sp. 15711]|uniref:2,4'-dihydroxyacetophenone dioxygenase family protein n=1 Tax=Caballeronia sp. 15711 TaxID=3391029 RepID=UPI0039E6BC4B
MSMYMHHGGVPWQALDQSPPSVSVKYLRIDRRNNETVSLVCLPFGSWLPRHRHTGPVSVYTVRGRWHYLEHDWVAEEGSIVQEADGSCHTPEVLDCQGAAAITLNCVRGDLHIMSRSGKVVGLENADTASQRRASANSYCVGPLLPMTLGALRYRHPTNISDESLITHWADTGTNLI